MKLTGLDKQKLVDSVNTILYSYFEEEHTRFTLEADGSPSGLNIHITPYTPPRREVIEMLERMQKADEAFFDKMRKETGGVAATYCADCKENTFVGSHPHPTHKYARVLCADCGSRYYKFLEQLGALNL